MTSNANCIFVGRLTRDSELKPVGNSYVVNTSMAINDSYVDKNGEKKERATFVDLEMWGFLAQNSADLKKGQMVLVVATPRMIQKEDGGKSSLSFRVEQIGVVPRAGKNESAAPVKTATKKTTKTVVVEAEDQDTPF